MSFTKITIDGTEYELRAIPIGKDYEILEGDKFGDIHPYLEKTCSGKCEIHSVKRLSDNEVFTVGDEIEYGLLGKGYIGKIEEFHEENGTITANGNPLNFWAQLGLMKKVKQRTVLFTTNDNIAIHANDDYWYVHCDFTFTHYSATKSGEYPGDYAKQTFSTEDKAKQYIQWNKQIFSLAEIMANSEYIPNFKGQGTYKLNADKLKELAQQKINDKT